MSLSTRTTLFVVTLNSGATAFAGGVEALFLAENNTAMAKMMAPTDVKPSGDADADFVATMVPHHQDAIDMAQAQLRYGRNEQLRPFAQEIIGTDAEGPALELRGLLDRARSGTAR